MPYQAFLDTLSEPRSGVYKRVFRTQTPEETCGAVMWGLSMSMALQSAMSMFEVTLRNRIHVSMSRQATENTGNPVNSFAWYDHQLGMRRLEGETFAKIERVLCDESMVRLPIQPSPDRVVAKLSFGIWPNILAQQLPNPMIEARTFLDVFPNYPKKPRKHWNHAANRLSAIDTLKDVRAWRNRISHCKPVWTEGWYRNSQTQDWPNVLNRVKGRHTSMLEVLEWMCPQTVLIYKQSYSGRLFNELITEEAVFAHINQTYAQIAAPVLALDQAAMLAYKARLNPQAP